MMYGLIDEVQELRAENTRLQERVKEEEGLTDIAIRAMERTERECDALQARVEELVKAMLPHALGPLGEPFFKTKADAEQALEQVEKESDRYKALAKVRVEALKLARDYVRSIAYAIHHSVPESHSRAGFDTCGIEGCQSFAKFDIGICEAIAMKPEEAGKKGGNRIAKVTCRRAG